MNSSKLLGGKIKSKDYFDQLRQIQREKGKAMAQSIEYTVPRHTSSEIVEVTPDMAKMWVDSYLYEKQRPVRKYHVDKLANFMKRGTFRDNSPVDFASLNGNIYLVNGQHTLNAIVKSGQTVPINVVVHKCKVDKDVMRLYSSFDRHLRRTARDTMLVYDVDVMDEIRSDVRQSAYSATGMVATGFENAFYASVTQAIYPWHDNQDTRAELLRSWSDELRMISEDAVTEPGVHRSIVSKIGFMAVALVTYRFAPDEAHAFWRGIMLDDGLARDDPRKAFIRAYQKDRTDGKTVRRNRTAFKAQAMYAASAWNAYLGNRQLMTLRVPTTDRYIRINKTPHDGKHHMVYVDADWNVHRVPFPLKNEEE